MIVVFGSLSADLVTRVERIPRPGETVLCGGYVVVPGGKGANQAVAAARAGARVALVGSRGDDAFGEVAVSLLRQAGVDLGPLATIDRPTGLALISVDEGGENAIVVASGSNQSTRLAQLEAVPLGPSDTVLLQREIPDAETYSAIEHAKAKGARTVLNVAPAGPVPEAALRALDVLVVNEHEALIVAHAVGVGTDDPEEAARLLNERFGCAAIVTLGPKGAVGWVDGVRRAVPALPVAVVDTTAAGDSFTGAFAAALDEGFGFTAAMARGAAAGSLACTAEGAQPSIPDRAAIDKATAEFMA